MAYRTLVVSLVSLFALSAPVPGQEILSDGFEWGSICAWSNLWYPDVDEDDYGDKDATGLDVNCPPPAGFVPDGNDCDDSKWAVNPDAIEVCDNLDNDCDGDIDGGAAEALTWYADTDLDSYGDPSVSLVACYQPQGYVSDSSDCDDSQGSVHPGAPELCDDLNNDCQNGADEGCDDDYDDYCDAAMTTVGTPANCPHGSGDCNDGDPAVNPSQVAYFNLPSSTGWDYNCDGSITLRFPSRSFGCSPGSGASCDGIAGYLDAVPQCGDTATYLASCNVNWEATIAACSECALACGSGVNLDCITCVGNLCSDSIVCSEALSNVQQECH